MGRKSKKSEWPKIRERMYQSGKVSYIVDAGMINGRRVRPIFPTKREAENAAQQFRIQREREGMAAFSLDHEQRVEAAQCYRRLASRGYTLTDAVNYFVDEVIAFVESPDVSGAIAQFMDDQWAKDVTDKHNEGLIRTLKEFNQQFGHRKVNQLKKNELEKFCYKPQNQAPKTYKHRIGRVSQFLNYCVDSGWTHKNPASKIRRPVRVQHDPGTLTPGEAYLLLNNALEKDLLGYISIGLFAGVRGAELSKLMWQDVRRDERLIIIGASIAKTRTRRIIEYDDTLAAWLDLLNIDKGPVVPMIRVENSMKRYRRDLGLKSWPHNALRHSFASYHLAMYQDAAKTAYLMGHVDGSELLHTNYRGLVTPADAERYWALRPGVPPDPAKKK